MKKYMLLSALGLSLVATTVSAQTTQTQKVEAGGTTFGIRAGANWQNINGKDADGDRLDNKLVTRFHVGVNAEIPVAPDFYFQPGLLFSTKGARLEDIDLPGSDVESRLNLSYLELPLNFLYKPSLGSGKLIVGLGPYVAYGIGGKVKVDGPGDDANIDVKFKNEVNSSDDQNKVYYKPFDAGANFLFGYEFANRLSAQLNAQLGLLNINSKYKGIDEGDARSANTGFGVSLGYRF